MIYTEAVHDILHALGTGETLSRKEILARCGHEPNKELDAKLSAHGHVEIVKEGRAYRYTLTPEGADYLREPPDAAETPAVPSRSIASVPADATAGAVTEIPAAPPRTVAGPPGGAASGCAAEMPAAPLDGERPPATEADGSAEPPATTAPVGCSATDPDGVTETPATARDRSAEPPGSRAAATVHVGSPALDSDGGGAMVPVGCSATASAGIAEDPTAVAVAAVPEGSTATVFDGGAATTTSAGPPAALGPLGVAERIGLFVLLAPSLRAPTTNVGHLLGVVIAPEVRSSLEARGLAVVVDEPMRLELTDSGWRAAETELAQPARDDDPPLLRLLHHHWSRVLGTVRARGLGLEDRFAVSHAADPRPMLAAMPRPAAPRIIAPQAQPRARTAQAHSQEAQAQPQAAPATSWFEPIPVG